MRGAAIGAGTERNLGIHRLAELRGLVAFAAGGRLARQGVGLVGGHRLDHYRLCLYRREYVLKRPAFLRHFVSSFIPHFISDGLFPFSEKTPSESFLIIFSDGLKPCWY